MNKRGSRVSLIAAMLTLVAGAASATTVRHVDTSTLVKSSPEIVIGHVVGMRTSWNGQRTRLFTEIELAVERSLKGSPGPRLRLVQLGGELDGMRYSVPGCATFRAGEEVLVFVWRDRAGGAQVNAMDQGKFEITRRPGQGRALIGRSASGLMIGEAKDLRPPTAGQLAAAVTLEDMVAEIERLVAEEPK